MAYTPPAAMLAGVLCALPTPTRAHLSSGTTPVLPEKRPFAMSHGEASSDKRPRFARLEPSYLHDAPSSRAAALLPLEDAVSSSLQPSASPSSVLRMALTLSVFHFSRFFKIL